MSPVRGHYRTEALGALGVLALVAIVVLSLALYLQVFTPFVTATVKAERAGLLMATGSDVALRDVTVGKVSDVRPDGPAGALIDIKIDPSQAEHIPADVTAQLAAPTLFGPKFVDLVPPVHPSSRHLTSGALIERASVEVEANEVFGNLMSVLTKVQPSKVNEALGALAGTLRGRGGELGNYVTDVNRYLGQLNGNLPAIQATLHEAPPVIDTYANAAPNIMGIVKNFTVTSRTITENRASLDSFIISITQFGDTATPFLSDNRAAMHTALSTLRPTTAFLQRYSVMFPCLLGSLNRARETSEPAFGGLTPNLRSLTTFEPGIEAYKYPQNLATIPDVNASCLGGPTPVGTFPRHVPFNDGSPRLNTRDQPTYLPAPNLARTLFGNLGELVSK